MTQSPPATNYIAAGGVRQDWLDQQIEDIIEPGLPIVDAHHHLWERPSWRYLVHDLLADIRTGHNIIATVHLQARAMHRAFGPEEMRPVGETEFVNGVAAMSASGIYGKIAICAGIVGYADLRAGSSVRAVLEAHIRAGGDRFRGIRQAAAWHAHPLLTNPNTARQRLLPDPKFRQGFAELSACGLSYDAWIYHTQLPELIDLARAFPGTAIIVNHGGGPIGIGPYVGKREEAFAEWKKHIADLAACPNVSMKLGGLGMPMSGFGFHEQPRPPSSEQLASAFEPYVHTCIEAFGAKRCMFESNFPVDKGSYSYPVLWNTFKRLAGGASAAEKSDLFSGTAARIYRLDANPWAA